MVNLLVSTETIATLPHLRETRYTSRRPTRGPELELVNGYVRDCLPLPPKGQARTVFIEPRLDSGFPDVVVVYWHLGTASRWRETRVNLSMADIRVLHYLVYSGNTSTDRLRLLFKRGVSGTLDRLLEADLVKNVGSAWRALPLRQIFAIRRLIAIEAKVNAWRPGLSQALQNTWFASESYLLLPQIPKRSTLLEEALCFGLGVVTADRPLHQAETPARTEELPKSYASWLFNEWAWRASI